MLVAVSNSMQAVKLCTDKSSKLYKMYNGHKMGGWLVGHIPEKNF